MDANKRKWLSYVPAVAGAAASLIPGVGTLGAAAIGGGSELAREAVSGEKINWGSVGRNAALSAIPGGLGYLGKAAGGSSLLARAATTEVPFAEDQGARIAANVIGRNTMRLSTNDRNTLSDYSDYLMGHYKPDNHTLNELLATTHRIGKQTGLDVNNRNKRDAALQIGGFLEHLDGKKAVLR